MITTVDQKIESIIKYLQKAGFFALRLKSGKVYGNHGGEIQSVQLCPAGTPQITAVINGKAVFFSVKENEHQRTKWNRRIEMFKKTAIINSYSHREIIEYKTLSKIEKSGGDTYMVCDLEEIENIIKQKYL